MNESKTIQKPQTCAWCAGTGARAISTGYVVSCLVCGGKGNLSLPEPVSRCQKCLGSGRRNESDSCLTCIGTGWTRVFSQA